MRIGTDVAGNFLGAADGFATARDLARLGLLWANDGIAPSGERLISDVVLRFVRTPTPRWAQPHRQYGAGFWANSDIAYDAFSMAGGTGQTIFIIPSLKLVIVKLIHDDWGGYPPSGKSPSKVGYDLIRSAVKVVVKK